MTGGDAAKSVSYSQLNTKFAGYKPYYMYRQKNTVGNLENVGFSIEGHEGIYNVLMMEEVQTIFAVGAGAVSKLLDYKGALKKAISFFIIPIAISKHARLKASMLQDLEKGKLTEVDAINGAVSDYGRKVGCPTPMNDQVVEIIHKIEQGQLKPCADNIKYFD